MTSPITNSSEVMRKFPVIMETVSDYDRQGVKYSKQGRLAGLHGTRHEQTFCNV
uniref:Uncharacterized protein n=1 Tax=Candidatus Kentrum eta TaxID=2126337 RepID=A0A450UW80_9GAMM|nr:MAG: hypothetical protein BECKH772A_GA0070896_101105 [Candidatus Kentron sp. H]VFJ97406.1 MAG: hypothetical protein BECKH772B_GA0070898_101115 [Candidatus Kentron sp. H]VFK02799.1 MAG: hypothetical protein BECKH772C_GA0070978_101035 [Candidatus Kentron sp. H]